MSGVADKYTGCVNQDGTVCVASMYIHFIKIV